MADTKYAVRVMKPRKGAGFALMFFDLVSGFTDSEGTFHGLLTMTDFSLMRSQKGDLYFRGPSKLRTRGGEPVLKDGAKQYDELVKLYGEEQDGKFGPTKMSFALRKNIIEQAERAMETVGAQATVTAARGGAKAPVSLDELFGEDTPF